MNIIIVMSTYNGSTYIRDQIRSIQAQTISSWKLMIRDDGSPDNTIEIIQEFTGSDKRIALMDESPRNLGPTQSFSALVNHAMELNPDYLMFSDQDDYWEPWKIEETLKLVQNVENNHPKDTPVLAHTDLQVVDASLNLISNSYLKHQNMRNPDNRELQVLLSQNYITGCTIMVNKSLIHIAQPVPETAIMHDWWYGLCASATGIIAFTDRPSVKYRQHLSNVYGSSGFINMIFSGSRLRSYLARKRSNYLQSHAQDYSLRSRLASTKYSNSSRFDLLDKYCNTVNQSGIRRLCQAIKLGIHQQGLIRNLYYYYSLLFIRPFKTSNRRYN